MQQKNHHQNYHIIPNRMKIALLGADGQLGHDLEPALQAHEIIPLTRRDMDVADFDRTRRLLMDLSPHVILNTTAYHRVDDCENQPELAFQVNALAVLNLVRIANDSDAVLLHISTDYVLMATQGKLIRRVGSPYRRVFTRPPTFQGNFWPDALAKSF